MSKLTHIDETGRAHMVDVSDKAVTSREASAEGFVRMDAATLALALSGDAKKGDVRATAEIDSIARTAGLSPAEVRRALGLLELTGRVRRSGNRWARVAS